PHQLLQRTVLPEHQHEADQREQDRVLDERMAVLAVLHGDGTPQCTTTARWPSSSLTVTATSSRRRARKNASPCPRNPGMARDDREKPASSSAEATCRAASDKREAVSATSVVVCLPASRCVIRCSTWLPAGRTPSSQAPCVAVAESAFGSSPGCDPCHRERRPSLPPRGTARTSSTSTASSTACTSTNQPSRVSRRIGA